MLNIYKVGGCVRDKIMGLESKDIDFVCVLDDLNMSPRKGFHVMETYMKENGYQIFLSTPNMFTIRAKFPENHEYKGMVADFVLARKEMGYSDDSREPIVRLGTLYDDLFRRDFTCNALAEDMDGNIIDLFEGIWSINNKILVTPNPDSLQTMYDDPLRLLRAFRFSVTKDFQISPNIYQAIFSDKVLTKLEKVVSKERIREEVLKMMKHSTLDTLKRISLLERHSPRLVEIMFKEMWLKPTFEK